MSFVTVTDGSDGGLDDPTLTTSVDITKYGGIPLRRMDKDVGNGGLGVGYQFRLFKGKITASDAPTLKDKTDLSYCFSFIVMFIQISIQPYQY